jgi:hypothetical protein
VQIELKKDVVQDKVSELDSVCYVPETAYWSKLAKKGQRK